MSKTKTPPIWFSTFFGIDIPQYALPFVDFRLNSDVPIYVDPYSITKDQSELAVHCHNAIGSYFQCLLDAVRCGDAHRTKNLIHDRLVEPKQIHLGVGRTARAGAGLGQTQERQIVAALLGSNALKTGVIHTIQELELHIEGIGPDKISDLVTNIIKGYLAEYTELTCDSFGIATHPYAVSGFWNLEAHEWDSGYFNIPANDLDSYILVPKRFVRLDKDTINHAEFYRHHILDFLQRELITANDSLVHTLRSGRRVVTKKDISRDPRFPSNKRFISRFISEHPDVINGYRTELEMRFAPVDPAQKSGKAEQDEQIIQSCLQTLASLPTGRKDAGTYHDLVLELIKYVFDWALENFEKEYNMDFGRGRIDIVCDNYAAGGLFEDLRRDLKAGSIPIECKNYGDDLGNDEFNQMSDRLGAKSSQLGFVFCRKIDDYQATFKHISDRWLRQGNIILFFDDDTLRDLVAKRSRGDTKGIESRIRAMIRSVKFASP